MLIQSEALVVAAPMSPRQVWMRKLLRHRLASSFNRLMSHMGRVDALNPMVNHVDRALGSEPPASVMVQVWVSPARGRFGLPLDP